jgi:hypothetical protein
VIKTVSDLDSRNLSRGKGLDENESYLVMSRTGTIVTDRKYLGRIQDNEPLSHPNAKKTSVTTQTWEESLSEREFSISMA